MNAQKCLDLLREIKDVAFATVSEDGKPQIRIIDVMLAENEKLYFCTARGKDFYRQLMASGDVAVTGLTKDWQMIRLDGRAEKLEDQKMWIDRIFEENPSMKGVYPGESRYILEPFCISEGQVEFFDLGKSPIYRAAFRLGSDIRTEKQNTDQSRNDRKAAEAVAPVKKGFLITDACIGCGKCAGLCPQQCIEPGTPYRIMQEHCLHCGLCFENCPVSAIEKRLENESAVRNCEKSGQNNKNPDRAKKQQEKRDDL